MPEEVKAEIMAEVKKIKTLLNKSLKDGDMKFRMNDVIIEAIRKGLKQIKP
jgi:hypothetical protein